MAKINFGGVLENVATREEFPLEKAKEVLTHYAKVIPSEVIDMDDVINMYILALYNTGQKDLANEKAEEFF